MGFWRELIILLIMATVASVILGTLLSLAVTQMYPDIDPIELYGPRHDVVYFWRK